AMVDRNHSGIMLLSAPVPRGAGAPPADIAAQRPAATARESIAQAAAKRRRIISRAQRSPGSPGSSGGARSGASCAGEAPAIALAPGRIEAVAVAVKAAHRLHVGDMMLAQPARHHAARTLGVEADK